MSELTKRIRISAPTDRVWNKIAELGNVASWAPTVMNSRVITKANRGVGAGRILEHDSGKTIEEVIVDWNEGHSFTLELPNGLGPVKELREIWSVKPSTEGSIAEVTMNFKMKIGAIGALFMVKQLMSKELTLSLACLKHHIETGEFVTSETVGLPVAAVE